MTTVLSVCQQAVQPLGIPPPSTIIATNGVASTLFNTILLAQSRFMRDEALWPQQKRTATLSVTSGRALYPLATDFHAFVFDSQYDTARKLKLRRLGGDFEFSQELYGTPSGITPVAIRIFGADGNLSAATAGGQLQISPTPTASGTYTYEYYTKNLFYPAYWTVGETGITLNTYRFSNGNIYKCTTAGTGVCASTPPSGTTTFSEAAGGPTWTYQDIAYETIIANTDQSLWGDSVMIAGVKWRYLESKGQPYEKTEALHDKALLKEFARFQISAVGSFDRQGRNLVKPSGDRYGGFFT